MALSEVSIVNLALTLLGQDRVIAVSDDVESARVMRSLWDGTRDMVMAAHPWKFAIKRAELPSVATPPAFGWSQQFAIPEECLRLVQVGDDWTFYESTSAWFALEGGAILTDEAAPLRVRYVRRITNTGLWPPLFCRVVSLQLALDACEKLTNSSAKIDRLSVGYTSAIREAKRQNAIERPPLRADRSDWLSARGD